MAKKSAAAAPSADVLTYDTRTAAIPSPASWRRRRKLINPIRTGTASPTTASRSSRQRKPRAAQPRRGDPGRPRTARSPTLRRARARRAVQKNKHVGIGDYVDGFEAFTPEQRDATREAIGLWDDLIAVDFVEKNGAGRHIVYMNTSTGPAQASAYTPFGWRARPLRQIRRHLLHQEQPDTSTSRPGYGSPRWSTKPATVSGSSIPATKLRRRRQPHLRPRRRVLPDSYQFSMMSYFHAGNTGSTGYVNWATGGYYQTRRRRLCTTRGGQAMYGVETTTRTATRPTASTRRRTAKCSTSNRTSIRPDDLRRGRGTTRSTSAADAQLGARLREGEFSSGFGQKSTAPNSTRCTASPSRSGTGKRSSTARRQPRFLSDNIASLTAR